MNKILFLNFIRLLLKECICKLLSSKRIGFIVKIYSSILLFLIHLFVIFLTINAHSAFEPSEYGWKQNKNMNPQFVDRTYLDVQFLKEDPNFGWACGFQGSFLRTTDGGKSWETYEIFSIPDGQIESLHFLNRNVGYLTITSLPQSSNGATFKTTNGGVSWTTVLTDNNSPTEPKQFWGHYFLDENLGVVLGGICGGSQFFYKTTNGGVSWSRFVANAPEETKLSDPILYEDGTGYAVSSGFLWKSTDFGSTWEYIEKTHISPMFTLRNPQTVYRSNQNSATYTTKSGSIITIRKISLNLIYIESDIDTIIIAKDNNGFIATSAGDTVYFDGNTLEMKFSEDYFTKINVESFDWHEEIAKFNNSIFLPYSTTCTGQNDSPAGFLFTTDLGKNWNKINTTGPNYGTFLLDAARGWGCGFNRTVIYTSNAGQTWTNVNCGIPDDVNLDDIWFINDTTAWVVGDGIYELTKIQRVKPIISPADTIMLCKGETITLEITEDFESYQWNNGRNTKSVVINEPGNYYVAAYKNFICDLMYSDTVVVMQVEPKQIEISASDQSPVCEGDTIELSASDGYLSYLWSTGETSQNIIITDNGTYSVVGIDSNGCESSAFVEFVFTEVPDAEIVATGQLSFCVGQQIELIAKPDGYRYLWIYSKNSHNTEIFSSEQVIIPDRTGSYSVIVETENGCSDLSDIVFIEVKDDSNRITFRLKPEEIPVEIDDTKYPSLTCRNLVIENISPDEQIIDEIYFLKNVMFSLPTAQLPIILPANSTAEVTLCFSPQSIADERDTLVIGDVCSKHYIPFIATGIGNNYLGNTKCEIFVEANTVDILQKYDFKGDFPFPNPTTDQFIITYKRTSAINELPKEKYYLVNSLGQKVALGLESIIQSSADSGYKSELGEIVFDTQKLISGLYFAVIESENQKLSYPIIIAK